MIDSDMVRVIIYPKLNIGDIDSAPTEETLAFQEFLVPRAAYDAIRKQAKTETYNFIEGWLKGNCAHIGVYSEIFGWLRYQFDKNGKEEQ